MPQIWQLKIAIQKQRESKLHKIWQFQIAIQKQREK